MANRDTKGDMANDMANRDMGNGCEGNRGEGNEGGGGTLEPLSGALPKVTSPEPSGENPVSRKIDRTGNRLTWEQWAAIRVEYFAGKSIPQIAKEFTARGIPISRQAISKRRNKERWSDMPDTLPPQLAKARVDLIAGVRKGMTPINAAAACGLHEKDFKVWMARDPGFREELEIERLAYLGAREAKIAEAGDRGDLRANLVILERSPESRETWAPRTVGGQGFAGITVVLNVSDPQPLKVVPSN